MDFIHGLFVLGIVVESMSGALAAGRKHMDFFGVIVIATITGLGGGTLRDILIGQFPLLWVKQPLYLLYSIIAAIVTIIAVNFITRRKQFFLILDALGLAAFSIVATERGLDLGLHPSIIVIMAMITGVAGGMMRDILCNDMPLVLRRELYAIVAVLASVCFQIINYYDVSTIFAEFLTLLVAFGLRLAAIKWRIQLPNFIVNSDE